MGRFGEKRELGLSSLLLLQPPRQRRRKRFREKGIRVPAHVGDAARTSSAAAAVPGATRARVPIVFEHFPLPARAPSLGGSKGANISSPGVSERPATTTPEANGPSLPPRSASIHGWETTRAIRLPPRRTRTEQGGGRKVTMVWLIQGDKKWNASKGERSGRNVYLSSWHGDENFRNQLQIAEVTRESAKKQHYARRRRYQGSIGSLTCLR